MKIIELPFYYPGTDKYEDGWNDCLNEVKKINNVLEKENEISFLETCLMSPKCPCDDCKKENIKMD